MKNDGINGLLKHFGFCNSYFWHKCNSNYKELDSDPERINTAILIPCSKLESKLDPNLGRMNTVIIILWSLCDANLNELDSILV